MDEIKNHDELIEEGKEKFFLLMKFGSRKNLEMLQQGKVYMKNLQYYIDLETATEDEDVGDKFDGLLPLQDVKVSVYTVDSNEFVTQINAPIATMDLGYKKSPVFCMFILDYRNTTSTSLTDDELKIRFDFSDEQKNRLKNFGDSVLLITNVEKFFARMKNGLNDAGISYTRDRVKYYDRNALEHIKDIQDNNARIGFWKRKKYEYQQEYRFLAFDTMIDDHVIIDIENLSDISRLESTEVILNTFVEVKYKIDQIEE
ncbi:hypothetical protein [Enterococcus gallinarum]|uniref:hypothetical protein n=1 Tax=Enterococcus gallinarum TaxID=1353 RepID=UPI001F0495D8|nr:hypothetical protein [Enterococcus gallinarum]